MPRDGEQGEGWGGSLGKGREKGACRSFWHKGRLVSVTAPRAWSTVHLHVGHHGPSGTTRRAPCIAASGLAHGERVPPPRPQGLGATITMHGARRVVPKAALRPEERLKMEINKKTST
jgi:hypothetical protein